MEKESLFIRNNILNPHIIEHRNEIHVFYEYLIQASKEEVDNLVELINNKKISKLYFSKILSDKIYNDLDFSFLNKVNKVNIKQLGFDEINYNYLYGFENLEILSLNLNKKDKLYINKFTKLNHLSVTGFTGDNLCFENPNIYNISFMFYSHKNAKFNYSLPFNKCKFLTFRKYKEIDFDSFKNTEVYGLDIYGCKSFIIDDKNIFTNVKEINFDKCDLSFIDEDVLVKLSNLEVLCLENCKNLKSLKFLSSAPLKKVVLDKTKIEDLDISILYKADHVYFTKYKDYIK